MPCPNCGGEGVAHIYYGGSKGEWRCLSGCPWTTRQGKQKCVVCGAPDAYLCDYPMPEGGTCDAPLCWRHTAHLQGEHNGEDIDYCPAHSEELRRQDEAQESRSPEGEPQEPATKEP